MDYTLDASAAKKADVINARIEHSGKYDGVFTRAESVISTKGTKGVDLSFKAAGGESADYLTLWTHNKEGKTLMGFNTLMAIMMCLRVRGLSAEAGVIEKYVKESGTREKVNVQLYKDLMDKPISLLIQMEESEYEGKYTWKPVIFGVCDKDGFTASEISTRATKAETAAKMLAALKDKPAKRTGSSSQNTAPDSGQSFSNASDNFSDDTPW